jgi:hypothetical protein
VRARRAGTRAPAPAAHDVVPSTPRPAHARSWIARARSAAATTPTRRASSVTRAPCLWSSRERGAPRLRPAPLAALGAVAIAFAAILVRLAGRRSLHPRGPAIRVRPARPRGARRLGRTPARPSASTRAAARAGRRRAAGRRARRLSTPSPTSGRIWPPRCSRTSRSCSWPWWPGRRSASARRAGCSSPCPWS